MSVTSVAELFLRLEGIEAEVDLFSFDIFDTLLERYVEPPDVVKPLALRRAIELFSEAGGDFVGLDLLSAAREEVESEFRARARNAGFDYECSFSDMANELARRFAPGKETAMYSALVEGELEAEKQALFPKPLIVDVLANLKARGKRIVAISDMYLDAWLIVRIFEHFGLDRFIDRVYVSSDKKLGKYSGRLFSYVLETEGVLPERMIHVGDHPHSDVVAPRLLGIRAHHLLDKDSLRRRQLTRTLHWLGQRNPFWRGESLMRLIPPAGDVNFHYRYGYSYLGPIYCTFVLGLIEDIRRCSIDKVYFLAREGDLFRMLYSKMTPAFAMDVPPANYLYISRKSVFLPASWRGLTRRCLDVVLSNPKQKGLTSLANALGISADEFADVAYRFGLDGVEDPIREWPEEALENLLADGDFQKIIISHSKTASRMFRRYLDQEGFFGKQRVALVDIGWNGTIQHGIKSAFGEDENFPQLTGRYLSFNYGFKYEFSSDEVKGVLYDSRTSSVSHNVFALFEELFENSARAFHATTEGYYENGGKVEPLLRGDNAISRLAERRFEERAGELRRGVLDFADSFSKAIRLTGYCFEDIKPMIISMAERCVVYPSREETTYLLETEHAEDFGSNEIMSFSDYRLPGPTIVLRPKRFLRLMRTSNWKYGTAKTLGLPGFNYLLRRIELALVWYKGKRALGTVSPRPLLSERLAVEFVKRGGFPLLNRVSKIFHKIWQP